MKEKNIVVIGHVDAGKSTLIGRLLVDIGVIDKHRFEQSKLSTEASKKLNQLYSNLLDENEEEQIRGKTHEFNEIKFIYEDEGSVKYTIIDTPGHQQFVRSMISGISRNVKNAIVVVSMAENEFNASFTDGMLKEHLTLATSIGIEKYLIVANKMDKIGWDYDKTVAQVSQVKLFLMNKLHVPKDDVKFCFVNAYSGEGLIDPVDVAWIKTKPLIHMFDMFLALNGTNGTNGIDNDRHMEKYEINVNSGQCVVIDVHIFQLENPKLITLKYMCMIHYDGKEAEVVVNKINNKLFLREGDTGLVHFMTSEPIKIFTNGVVILRRGDMTIGVGTVKNIHE